MQSFPKKYYRFGLMFLVIILLSQLSTITATENLCAQSPFTTHDALRVKSLRVHSITDDGHYIAGIINSRKDRLNVDHKRFGDPTYSAPNTGEIIIINTETKEILSVFKEKVQAHSLTWSPDGKMLAFFLRQGNNFYLHTFDMKNKILEEIRPKTDKQIASNSFLRWIPDGTGIILALRNKGWDYKSHKIFLEATEGPIIIYDSRKPMLKWEEIRNMSALHIIAKVDMKSYEVTELLPEGRYNNIRQSKDGSFITYIQYYPLKTDYTRKGGTEYELCMHDMKTSGDPKVLIKRAEKRLNLSWNEENKMFAWADKGDIFMQSVYDEEPQNLTKDKVKPAGDDTAKVRFSLERWSRDGSKLLAKSKKGYWLIDHQSGDIEMVYELPETEEERHRSDPVPFRLNEWSPDGRYLYMTYSATDKWDRGYMRYDLESRRMEKLIKDSNLYSGWQMSKNGEKFFYNYSDGDLPNNLYMTDKEFSSTFRLTDLNPWIKEKKLTKSELIKYLDIDGNELYGILYYPVDYEQGKKYPLVCEIYERFFNNGFNANMNLIANAGFFGFRPSVNLEIGYPGESWIKGITCGINKVIDRGIVDPEKLGVHGTSYGGYATSLLITQTNRFAAAINISGKTNMISFLGDSPRIGTRNYAAAEVGQDRLGATLWEQPMKYFNHSAVMFADRVETPHLLLTGEGDWNVPAASTREMYYALRRLGKECVWVNYYNGGHGAGRASNEAEFHDMWKRIFDWYNTYFDKADKEDEEK